MEQIVDELDTTTDADRYDKLVNEYNTLLERHQNEYKTIDTGNEKANKIADTIGSLIGIGTPIPGAGFTKLEPFRPIGKMATQKTQQAIANMTSKVAEKGLSDAGVRALYFVNKTIPQGIGNAAQFSIMQSVTNIIDPSYENMPTVEKIKAVGNSALWGFVLGQFQIQQYNNQLNSTKKGLLTNNNVILQLIVSNKSSSLTSNNVILLQMLKDKRNSTGRKLWTRQALIYRGRMQLVQEVVEVVEVVLNKQPQILMH